MHEPSFLSFLHKRPFSFDIYIYMGGKVFLSCCTYHLKATEALTIVSDGQMSIGCF